MANVIKCAECGNEFYANEVPLCGHRQPEPPSITAKAEWLRAGGYTRRYHGWRTLKDDPVGQHSYNVANLVLLIRPDCSKELVVAAVRHDAAEHRTGDMPSDTKRAIPGAKAMMDAAEDMAWAEAGMADPCKSLSAEEYRILKLADYFDGMMFCIQEREMGSTMMDVVFNRYMSYMTSSLEDAPYGPEHDLFNGLAARWAKLGGPFNAS